MPNQVGNNLRRLREQRGLTQTDLSEKPGISQQMVSGIEKSVKTPEFETIMALSGQLGCYAWKIDPKLFLVIPEPLAPAARAMSAMSDEKRQRVERALEKFVD